MNGAKSTMDRFFGSSTAGMPFGFRGKRGGRAWWCAVFLATALLIGLDAGRSATGTEIVAADYPPFMIKDGKNPGFSLEIVKLAERRIGRDSPVTFLPFKRSLKTVLRRNDVLHAALYRTPERETKLTWVAWYRTFNDVFLTLGPPVNSLEQARALGKIGVEAGNAMDLMLTRWGFTNLERADRAEINARKLAAGRIDAWALTDVLAQWIWKRVGSEKPLTIGRPFHSSECYVAAGPGFPEEEARLYRDAIHEMLEDGTIDDIFRKYR